MEKSKLHFPPSPTQNIKTELLLIIHVPLIIGMCSEGIPYLSQVPLENCLLVRKINDVLLYLDKVPPCTI